MTRLLVVLVLAGCATTPKPTRTLITEYFGRCTEKVVSGTPDIRDTERRGSTAEAEADIASFLTNFPSYTCTVLSETRAE